MEKKQQKQTPYDSLARDYDMTPEEVEHVVLGVDDPNQVYIALEEFVKIRAKRNN